MMKRIAIHRSRTAAAVAIGLLTVLVGCGGGNKQRDDVISARVARDLPAYVSVNSIKTQTIKQENDVYYVNWKAAVTPKEDLYKLASPDQSVRDPESSEEQKRNFNELVPARLRNNSEVQRLWEEYRGAWPKHQQLDRVQKKDQEQVLYGHCEARQMVDAWQVVGFAIESGKDTLGKPRGSFEKHCILRSEVDDAIKTANDTRKELRAKLAQTVDRLLEAEWKKINKEWDVIFPTIDLANPNRATSKKKADEAKAEAAQGKIDIAIKLMQKAIEIATGKPSELAAALARLKRVVLRSADQSGNRYCVYLYFTYEDDQPSRAWFTDQNADGVHTGRVKLITDNGSEGININYDVVQSWSGKSYTGNMSLTIKRIGETADGTRLYAYTETVHTFNGKPVEPPLGKMRPTVEIGEKGSPEVVQWFKTVPANRKPVDSENEALVPVK